MADHHAVRTVDNVFTELRQRLPSVTIERLEVKYSADDDNVWFIKAEAGREVQLDAHPDGHPPFHVEGDSAGQRCETSRVEEAVELIIAWPS